MNRLPLETCNTLRQGLSCMKCESPGRNTVAVIALTYSVKSMTTEVMWLLMPRRWGLSDLH